MRKIDDTYEEIKLRAALAVAQWESLQEKSRIFKKEIQEAKEFLERVNTARIKMLQPTDVDANSS